MISKTSISSMQPPLPGMPGIPHERNQEEHFPYLERLTTPHARILDQNPELIPVPILESGSYKMAVAAYEASPKSFDDKFGAAIDLAALVRKSLWYKSSVKNSVLMNPESVALANETNCYGYTIVLSELLQKTGIKHFIGFSNTHSFLLFNDELSGQIKMIDPVTRKFDGDITGAVWGDNFASQIEEGKPFGSMQLNTTEMLKLRGLELKSEAIIAKKPWLSFEDTLSDSYNYSPKDAILQLRVFPAEAGRNVLQAYADAIAGLNAGNLDASAKALFRLDGIYPDVDPRNDLVLATRVRTELLKRRKWGSAMKLADVVLHSLEPGDKSDQVFFHGDTARAVANLLSSKIVGRTVVMQDAIDRYNIADGNEHIKKGKIRKAEEQLARINAEG